MKLAIAAHYEPPFMFTRHVDFLTNALLHTQRTLDGEVRWIRGNGWCSATRHNNAVDLARQWGADRIIFFDPDQVAGEDVFVRLALHLNSLPVVAALYPSRGPVASGIKRPFEPVGLYHGANLQRGTGLQLATHLGTGCFGLRMSVFDRLTPPYFTESIDPQTFRRTGSMDIQFVRKLQQELDIPIVVDTDIEVRHLNIFEIDSTYPERFSDWPPASLS